MRRVKEKERESKAKNCSILLRDQEKERSPLFSSRCSPRFSLKRFLFALVKYGSSAVLSPFYLFTQTPFQLFALGNRADIRTGGTILSLSLSLSLSFSLSVSFHLAFNHFLCIHVSTFL